MKSKNVCLAMCLLTSCLLQAQVEDDFTDGELLNNPEWLCDLPLFAVNDDKQLQLNADGVGEACISTYLSLSQNIEWRCWARLKFSPSANNNARIYLISDKQDLKAT